MNDLLRRWLGCCSLGACLLLSACRADPPAWLVPWRSAATATPAAGALSGAPAARSTLQLLALPGSAAENAALQSVVDHFVQSQPTYSVTLTLPPDYEAALTTALIADPPPDVVVLDATRALELAASGALAPLAAAVGALDDFHPLATSAFAVGEQPVCAPRELRTLALLYNRELFDAAGVAYPTASWTWDDLRAAAEALTNSETATFGLALPPDFSRWLPFLYQAGGSVTDEAMTVMTINSAEATTAMTYYTGLVIDGFAAAPADLESSWAGEALGRGRAAMAIEGNWAMPYLTLQFPQLKLGVVELPTGPQGRATLAFATCYAVPARAPNRAAAWQLVAYLTGPEAMTALATESAMPARLSVLATWMELHPEQAAFANGLPYARPWQLGARFGVLFSTVNSGLQQAFLSVRSVADILAEADGVGNRALTR
jgi:multiple sugar transport system substrate-binding protein